MHQSGPSPGVSLKSPRSERRCSRLAALACGMVFGLCVYAAFPPVGAWPTTMLSVVALIWAAARGFATPARTALHFGLGSLPCWFAEQFWLVRVTPVGYPLLALYHGAFTGLTVYVLASICACRRREHADPADTSHCASSPISSIPLFIAAPLACIATEFLRGEVFLSGYCWFLIGHPFIDMPLLAAPAAVFGAYFVSFLAAAACGAAADLAGWSGSRRRGAIGLPLVIAVWAVSAVVGSRTQTANGPSIRIGVVQTNVPQGQKINWTAERIASDFKRFIELTRALAEANPRPDLIVWPETMFPGVSLNERTVEAFEAVFRANNPRHGADDRSLNGAMVGVLRDTQRQIGIPMFIGSKELVGTRMERDGDGQAVLVDDARYNSVVVIHDGRVLDERYDKVELTPFGEFIPVAWRWPWLERQVLSIGAGGMRFDLTAGTGQAPLTIPGLSDRRGRPVRAATPICFEVTRSELCRRLAGNSSGAHLLINLSNDGWFGDFTAVPVPSDAGRAQHQLAARWRCIELGLPMVRAVNTGLCSAIDPTGRLLRMTAIVPPAAPTRADGALVAAVSLADGGTTLFSRVGNVFGWTAMSGGWLLFAVSRLHRQHKPCARSIG